MREAELKRIGKVKGWPTLYLNFDIYCSQSEPEREEARELFNNSALICDAHGDDPLAVIYTQENRRYAWLPAHGLDQLAWVKVILMDWAESDPNAFAGYSNLMKYPQWMTTEEEELSSKIAALEQQEIDATNRIRAEIHKLTSQLTSTTLDANNGRRRLLTAQDKPLVAEVTKVFREMGFIVDNVDESLAPNAPKREDLRLRDPQHQPESWEAIVEVRGYSKSSFSTADLQRLSRFAALYQKEKGRLPDKRIYVVNGQTDLIPPLRDIPLASAPNDLQVFSEDNGLVIWTPDLFRVAKRLNPDTQQLIRDSIKHSVGRWTEGSSTQTIAATATNLMR